MNTVVDPGDATALDAVKELRRIAFDGDGLALETIRLNLRINLLLLQYFQNIFINRYEMVDLLVKL